MSKCWLPELVQFVFIRTQLKTMITDKRKSFILKNPEENNAPGKYSNVSLLWQRTEAPQ